MYNGLKKYGKGKIEQMNGDSSLANLFMFIFVCLPVSLVNLLPSEPCSRTSCIPLTVTCIRAVTSAKDSLFLLLMQLQPISPFTWLPEKSETDSLLWHFSSTHWFFFRHKGEMQHSEVGGSMFKFHFSWDAAGDDHTERKKEQQWPECCHTFAHITGTELASYIA